MVGAAFWCWAGVLAGRRGVVAVMVVAVASMLGHHRRRVMIVVMVAATAGALSAAREANTLGADVPMQARALIGQAVSDGSGTGFALEPTHVDVGRGWERWEGPRMWVRGVGEVEARQRLMVEGTVRPGGFRTRHGPVAGAVVDASWRVVGAPGLFMAAGAAVRHRVTTVFDGRGPGPALVTGFLIGDTGDVSDADLEALRRSGLSHFVAVSGSNVALVVGGWWILAGLFIPSGRIRALGGLAVIVVFAIATRWEPSVVRASVMAAMVLAGRVVGRPVPAWSALAAASGALVLISPELADSVGFQLSVAATGGVLMSAGAGSGPIGTAAAATIGAQAAVAPLLLLHFGAVPLLAPVANVLAAPLVTIATAGGAIAAVFGVARVGDAAGWFADSVTLIANVFAAGPQLDLLGVVGAAVVAAASWLRWSRPLAVGVMAAVLAVSSTGPSPPDGAEVIFLDVGQGDSLLVRDGKAVVLIDGGPDPAVLREALRRYGVRRLDLVVVSHPHSYHIAGLTGIVHEMPIGRLWYPPYRASDPALADLIGLARQRGIVTESPALGAVATLGGLRIEVLGPRRRYVSLNDGSLVVAVTAGGPRLLVAGDIEVVAQHELAPPPVDILKVPHQGAATSDLEWLRTHAGGVAVVSVGPNTYGHPSDEVIATLRAAGAEVLRTDVEGDITVSLATVAP